MDTMSPSKTTILINGRFYDDINDNEGENTVANCMVIQDEKIRYIGSENHDAVRDAKSAEAETVDMKNRLILPGFINSHVHLLLFGLSLQKLDLAGCKSLQEVRQRIASYASSHPDVPRILCRGWLQSATNGKALASMIDDLDPRPIFIDANDLHSTWCNTAALNELPIEEMKAACGQDVTCDESGNPTGLLAEAALTAFVWPHLTKACPEEDKQEALHQAVKAYAAAGYTGVIDMAMDSETWLSLQLFRKTQNLNLHIAAHWFVPYESDKQLQNKHIDEAVEMHRKWHPSISPEFCVVGIKMICDGVVDGCTAALTYPYGEQVDLAQPFWPAEAMTMVIENATKAGMQCAIHAIGDAAVTQAVDAIAASNNPDARHRIEHLELASVEDANRLGKLGITASVQPVHSDPAILEGYAKLIKPFSWDNAFPYKECLDGEANVALGTDAPTACHLPFLNLHNATTRRSAIDLTLEKVTNGKSAITLAQAVKAATYGAAYSRFTDEWTGRLKEGLRADLLVLEGGLETEKLLGAKVAQTWYGGRKTYDGAL